ncbi:HlyD family efflux transporter periplasmic adaptor subunit [Candidatus Peregrinibacteria bacterium]|nr:HlyD family efflux transporter periplasmic adaptor subunit [Candidatus Peregrinibacteria bacterium]
MRKRTRNIVILIGAIAVIGGGTLYFASGNSGSVANRYETAEVMRGNLAQTVTATGSVKGTAEISLSFPISGKIESLAVSEGDRVSTGQTLAKIESWDLDLKVEMAKSALLIAEANLALKSAGNRKESIRVSEAEVSKSKASFESAKNDLSSLQNEYEILKKSTAADIANAEISVQTATDNLSKANKDLANVQEDSESNVQAAYEDSVTEMKGSLVKMKTAFATMDEILGVDDEDQNDAFESYLKAKSLQLFLDTQNLYKTAHTDFLELSPKVTALTSSDDHDSISALLADTLAGLKTVYDTLQSLRILLDNAITGSSFSQTSLDAFKSDIDTELTTINTEITSLESAEQILETAILTSGKNSDTYDSAVTSAKNALSTAEQNLSQIQLSSESKLASAESKITTAESNIGIAEASLKLSEANLALAKAGPRDVDLAPLSAEVSRATADLHLTEKNRSDAVLLASASGVITDIVPEIGEQVALNAPVVSLLVDKEFMVEVDVSESDIVKVDVDDPVEITLDAYGDDMVFRGKVHAVDPGPTIIADVIYYKVMIFFDSEERVVKQDMTANITIFTDTRDNVLYVSQRAVKTREEGKYVQILVNGEAVEKEVKTGLRADDGFLEVISGLSDGEDVVVFDRTEKTAKF